MVAALGLRRGGAVKILALLTGAFGDHGGIARYNRDLLMALSASSVTESVVVLPRVGGSGPSGLPAKVRQAPAIASRAGYAIEALRLASRHGPFDVIFCGHLYMAPLAALVARLAGAPVWSQIHGVEAWRAMGRMVQGAAARAALVTSVSRHTRDRFLQWANVEPGRARVLPNTVEERFAPGPWPAHLARRHDLEGRKTLLTVSRLDASERYKGHDRVIAALPAVRAARPDAVYVVAGDGGDRPRLERLARETGVAAHVRFAGRVADEELPDYYRLADVFVMPSTGEGFGIVFLEAAATGIPVIGGSRDGGADALAEGAIGAAVDPEDAGALARAIVTMLDRPRRPDPAAVARFARPQFERHVDDLLRSLV